MPYIGQPPVTGDTTSSFRLLDNIASYTLTFNGSSAEVVSTANDTLTFSNHRFVTAQRVTYTHGGGTAIGGLTSGTAYYIIKVDQNTIKLATSAANANNNSAIDLTSLGVGVSHTLNVAFDGINTKFKATYNNGTKAQLSRAGQLLLSINGVIQQPQETSAPTLGFGIDADSTIVFSVAPAVSDVIFGNIIANSIATFDISDNNVDNFTGNGSTLAFTLSKTPANNQNVLVTLDGVVQYPSDTTTTRAYSVTGSTLTFASAPANGVQIQVRHIGFAGATTSAVTGFYGRTGNAVLTSADDINVQNITGVAATFTGNVSIAGTLTYEDVTNVDSVGLITARSGIIVNTGTATTALVVNGNARVTGILTIGTSSITLDGSTDAIRIGSGVTITSSGIVATSGVTTVSAGSTSAPSITPSGDSNTGIFFPSPDTIAFGEGGSEAARIDSSGRFGLGTTSPQGSLHVHDSASTISRIRLTNSTTTDATAKGLLIAQNGVDTFFTNNETGASVFSTSNTERARIDSSGRLLVGTSSSRSGLFNSNGIVAGIQLEGAGQPGNQYLSVIANANSSGWGSSLVLGKSRGTTVGSNTVVQSGDEIGFVDFQAADGTDLVPAARISCEVDGTPGANDMPGRLMFLTTADGASGPTERMRIDSSGRLLVGTSSSRNVGSSVGSRLQIEHQASGGVHGLSVVDTTDSAQIAFGTNNSGTVCSSGKLLARINFCGNDGTNGLLNNSAWIEAYADGTWGSNDVPGRLVFSTTADGASSPTERLRINSNGNVGLNTTDPDYGGYGDRVLGITGAGSSRGRLQFQSSTGTSGVAGSIAAFNGGTFLTSIDFAADGATNKGKIQVYTYNGSSNVPGPYVSNGGTSWTSSSDERYKDIIEPIADSVEKVGRLRAVIGKFKTDPDSTRRSFLIAQDVQAVFPEAVVANDPEHLGLNYQDLIPLLVSAIQEQQAVITELQAEVQALKAQ